MDYNPRGDKCIIGFADGDMYIYNDNTQTLESKLRSGTMLEDIRNSYKSYL